MPGRKTNRVSEADLILQILNRIPFSTRYVTADEIEKSLKEAGIEIAKRSLQRYLKKMVEKGEYGIVRDDRSIPYGYRRERTGTELSEVSLKPNECLLLRLAQEHMKFQMPGVVFKSLDFLFEAAEKKLNEVGSNTKEREWLSKVCVVPASLPCIPPKIAPRIFDAVSEALYQELKLKILYKNQRGKLTRGLVSPLGLVQQEVRLYLVCTFDDYEDIVHLALHRLTDAQVTAFPANRPEGFNLKTYVRQRHFNHSNGDWLHWTVEFEWDLLAKLLEESPFNKTQKLTAKEEGGWRLEVDIPDSNLLDGWVAMWQENAGITYEHREPFKEGETPPES